MQSGRAIRIFGGRAAVGFVGGWLRVFPGGLEGRAMPLGFPLFQGLFLGRWGFGGLVPRGVVGVGGCFPGLGFALW